MDKYLSQRVHSIPPSGIRRIFDLASQPGVISLAIGEPDFTTPPHIREAAKESLDRGETHYTANLGILELRRAIAAKMARVSGLEVEGDSQVIVTIGGVQALQLVGTALLNPGDEVLIPDPGFMVYSSLCLLLGAVPVPYPLRIENGFYPDMAEVEALVTPRTRMIIINSPGNPTGQLIPRERLEGLAALAERHDLLVVSDEMYDPIVYDGKKATCFATLPGMMDRTITVNGFSKAYAMTGWRIGYAVAHPAIVQAMMKIHQITVACAPTMVQMGALRALEADQGFIGEMVEEYQSRRDLITELLNRVPGFRCIKPEGAFYAFPDIRGTGMDSMQLSEFLLERAKVGCVPGVVFGARGEGHVRISYASSRETLQEAGERMRQALSR